MSPVCTSTAILRFRVNPNAFANFAIHRAPLPHCSTSMPSALKMRYLKSASAVFGRSTTSTWSAPIPKRRSASHPRCATLNSMRCRTPSSTTKSLPAPCILLNLRFISIHAWFARRPSLETPMHPVVLLRHSMDLCFKKSIHSARVFEWIAAWVFFPSLKYFKPVAAIMGQYFTDKRHDLSAGSLCQTGHCGYCACAHAKKRHKGRIARAIVHICAEHHRHARAQHAQHCACTVRARNHLCVEPAARLLRDAFYPRIRDRLV